MAKKKSIKIPRNLFLLSWKKLWILVVSCFISILLHNAIYGLFGVEDTFFFIIVIFVIPVYFAISLVYSLVYWFRKK